MNSPADPAHHDWARQDWRTLPYERLFDQRVVFLRGPLDGETATRVAAELMTLDADTAADDTSPIRMVVSSPGGPLECCFAVLDTVDLLTCAVDTLCLGEASGTAAAVLACGTGRRRAAPMARLGLRLREARIEGTASDLGARTRELVELRDRLAGRLADATGRPLLLVQDDLGQGGFLTAREALEYGLVDEIATR